MENELSNRLTMAVAYIREHGYARSDSEVARTLGVTPAYLCMSMNGDRTPTWDLLLNLCDRYPINFWWLRSGEGRMAGGRYKREQALLEKIERLEGRIRELEGK